MSREGKVVCVTGASGYIASWLVKLLLHRGYTVKATVRDPNDPKKVEHLCTLDGAKERLQLYRANLVEEGSFDAAVEGCEGVFHTASPAILDVEDPQSELLDPAVKGTLNVLRSCAKVPSIKRVILTSSMAAVMHNTRPLGSEVVVDESWYSDPDFCRETKQWYTLSKTLAEDAAWKYVKDMKFDMVTINPAVVLGSLLQPTLNGSSDEMIVKLLNGSETCPNLTLSWVHVKDVANAHILALEDPSANGRYCLAGFVANFSEIIKILSELYPDVILPKKCVGDDPYAPHQISQEKARSLGIDYIPLKTCLKDTVDSLKEKGFISI